jgi:hypothetical protein
MLPVERDQQHKLEGHSDGRYEQRQEIRPTAILGIFGYSHDPPGSDEWRPPQTAAPNY